WSGATAGTAVPAFRCRSMGATSRRLARQTLHGELVQIRLPVFLVIAPEIEEVVPAVDPGGVHVVEHETDGIIADRVHLEHHDVLLARHGLALVGRMPLHLGAWALHP